MISDDATQRAIARARAGELLLGSEVAAIFRLNHSQFHTQRKRGAFDQFLARPAIGLRCFSGTLLARYLDGQPVYLPTFGRKRA